ncbi:MAG: stalk domain-containing protein, partial [Oscillospiraceae bacterium]
MKILKRTLLLGLAALMVVPTVSANSGGMNLSETIDKKIEKAVVLYENSNVALINGVRKEIDIMNTDITPIEMDDRTLVPVKFVSESLGASVFWDDKTNTVSVSHGENLAKMKIGENVIEVNKDSIEIDVPATIINDVTMLPLRVISEKVLNKEVYWNDGLIGISDEKLEFSNPEISGVTERITQAPVYQRPYFPPTLKEKDGAIERADAILEKWTDEEYWCENFVPKQSPRINQYSPVKETGFKSNWKWDSEKPNEILDAASGLVFPNADYPYKYKDVTVFSGKVVSVPYLECYNTKMSKNVLVEAKIDAEKGRFLDKALSDLATAYTMTKDEKYARRVILSLDKWAEYLPDYFITRGWNLNEPISVEEAEKIDFKRVEWASDNNGFAAEMTLPQVKAIDYTFDSKTFEELSKEKGYDVRKNIEENFYGKKLEYFTKTVPVESFYATNLALAYGYFGQVATVLDKMDTIKKLGEYSTTSMDINFKRDKMLPESGTYHFYYARENRDVAMTLKKYFDIYPDKISENQDIYNKVNEQIDFLTKAMAAVNKFSYPDGNIAPYADCDKGITLKRNKSVSELMPGYGVAHLADGEFENQTVFNIGAIDTCGHTHYDRNSIQLFGFGEELIGDIRYARMPGRKYCNDSTFSHNTVIVDGKDQPVMSEVVKNQNYGNDGHAFNGGNISMFNDSIDGISVSEVNNAYAYDEANRYQRLNILNTKEEDKPYVLDVFVVEGGNRHEYMLHSSTQFDSTRKSDIEMEKLVGNDPERPLMEKGDTWEEFKFNIDSKENYYGIFKNVDYAENDGNYKVSFTKADGDVGLNIIMASDENETLYIGD